MMTLNCKINLCQPDLFLCDPVKNDICRKTQCYIYGGPCHKTAYFPLSRGIREKENLLNQLVTNVTRKSDIM